MAEDEHTNQQLERPWVLKSHAELLLLKAILLRDSVQTVGDYRRCLVVGIAYIATSYERDRGKLSSGHVERDGSLLTVVECLRWLQLVWSGREELQEMESLNKLV
jgi:hypothetical protein